MCSQACCCAGGLERSESDMLRDLEPVLAEYKDRPGGLIPALQMAQTMFGYLPEAVLTRVAEAFDKPLGEVAGVVSFYAFFTTVPRGRYLVRVCLGTACYVRGGQEVLQAIKRKLGIDIGETTPDRLFSLDIGRCFGACGMAPVIMVNDTVHQRVKPARVGDILAQYAASNAAPEEATP